MSGAYYKLLLEKLINNPDLKERGNVMSLIPGYPEGSDITVMNVTYIRPKKTEDPLTGKYKYGSDYICIVYRDNVQKRKFHKLIKDPKYTYYILDPKYNKPYNQFFVPSDKVEPVTCKYRDLEKDIAKHVGKEELFKDNIQSGNYKQNRMFHAETRIFTSDMNIEDHYRAKFAEEYTNNAFDLHKAFFDIEADSINMMGDFPEMGECPINCLSLYDEKLNIIFTYILRNPKNVLIEEFEKETEIKALYKELYDFIIEAVGGQAAADEFGVTGVKQEFHFFDSEISMLAGFFKKIHKIQPDFVEAWNMAFDIPYTIQRIINIGYDPVQIMSDSEYEEEAKSAFYHIDTRNYNDYAERTDFAVIGGNIVWLDQMLQFAQKRKSKIGSFTSFKLNDIGNDTVGVKKLDYSHITHDISKFPYLDFKLFVFYNIMDTVVQKCIEARCKDLDYIFTSAIANNTSYRKCYRQTVYLANLITKDFKAQGFIRGNNVNRLVATEKPDKYAGAIVTDVTLTGPAPRMEINGVTSMIVNDDVDFDYKALYPSAEMENNVAPNTQYGKIVLWNRWQAKFKYNGQEFIVWIKDTNNAHDWPMYPKEDTEKGPDGKKRDKYKLVELYLDEDCTRPFQIPVVEYRPENFETISYTKIFEGSNFNRDPKYEASGEMLENLMCENSIIFCNRYFKYATFEQFLDDLNEFLGINSQVLERTKLIYPIKQYPEGPINPIIEYGDKIYPIIDYDHVDGTELIDKLKNSL